MAIGNLHQFLPAILKFVQSDASKRLLSLHALKEVVLYNDAILYATYIFFSKVVTNCSHGQLEGVADLLWVPLFENSDNSEETTRNVAAACLGKLTTTHPSRYLPQLHVSALNLLLQQHRPYISLGTNQGRKCSHKGNCCICYSLHFCRYSAVIRRTIGSPSYGLPFANG